MVAQASEETRNGSSGTLPDRVCNRWQNARPQPEQTEGGLASANPYLWCSPLLPCAFVECSWAVVE